MSNSFDSAVINLSDRLSRELLCIDPERKRNVFEIRLRSDAPVMLTEANGCRVLEMCGRTVIAEKQDIDETFLKLCEYSVHSHESEIKDGFITSRNGHRAGICGKVSTNPDGTVRGFSEITSINLRIARSFKGVSDKLCRELFRDSLQSVIVAGPPVSGKTTMLRDIGRFLSEGAGGTYYTTAVVDSRCEIALTESPLRYCDIFSGCDKAYGIICDVRSMSSQMVICDEISTEEEVRAVSKGFASGSEFSLSVHAKSVGELRKRRPFISLAKTGQFRYTVMLDGKIPCESYKIYETEELLK